MQYTTEDIFKRSKELILEHKLFFIEDIVSFLPCAKSTFYKYIQDGSNELNELSKMLEVNKINLKVKMRKKWGESDNATLQMALMKLICTETEHRKLAQNYTNIEHSQNPDNPIIDYSKLSTNALKEIIDAANTSKDQD